jgi:nitrile hydratase subunit beta
MVVQSSGRQGSKRNVALPLTGPRESIARRAMDRGTKGDARRVMHMEPDNSRLTSAEEPGRGHHDLGGLDGGPIDTNVSQAKPWEKLAVVVGNALGANGAKVVCTDEVRRTREEMGAELYNRLGYFEKGIESLRRLLVEKGIIDQQALERRMAEVARRIAEEGR